MLRMRQIGYIAMYPKTLKFRSNYYYHYGDYLMSVLHHIQKYLTLYERDKYPQRLASDSRSDHSN